MNPVQGGAESISYTVTISLAQENNDIDMDREVGEENDVITYDRKKRLKRVELTDLESFNEGDNSSLGNMHQIIESSSLDQPAEFESVPHHFSSIVSEKSEAFDDGISVEGVQKLRSESLHSSSGYQNTSLIDDTSETGNADTDALMLPESRLGNDKVLNVASSETVTDQFLGLASSDACSDDFPVHVDKKECLPEHATTRKRKSCDADMLESNHPEELQDEAKETVTVVDGDALGGDAPLCHDERSMASHAALSTEMLDGTQVVSELVPESLNAPADGGFTGCKQKKLLVLDVNGLLIDICSYIPYNYDPDDIIMKKAVFRRPHCDDFLNFCFEKFNDQSHCTNTGYYTVEKRDKPLLLKKLKKLWDRCEPGLPWERGVYNESNTLLLDDTPSKALTNPPYTAVFPYTYRYRDAEDNSLGPGGDLRVYLEGLVEADNVQEYVKQNPFGQRPITEKNLSWGYYRKVIEANSTPPRQTQP